MAASYISVPRDLTKVKSKVMFNLTKRQLICFGVAALIGVPKELHEAAELDGAGEVKRFFKITLPLISPTIFYLLVTGLMGALQEFTRFQIMTPDGGPEYQGMTVVFYLYKQLFNASGGSDLGVASAMGWIIAVLITVVTILNFRMQRKWVNYD